MINFNSHRFVTFVFYGVSLTVNFTSTVTRVDGMNASAQQLMKHERDKMKTDPEIMKRVIHSYRLFLDFLGLELLSEDTGEVARTDNYQDRFYNLATHGHNNLRITRIIKCLGEMG